MTRHDIEPSPFARLGIQDLLLLAAWELSDQGQRIEAWSLLRAATLLEADVRVVSGPRARLLRALIDGVPLRDSVHTAIAHRLH